MSFLDLQLCRAYDTGDADQDVLHDFYLPALERTISYDRLTGFFSSSALAVAARGVAGLINVGGSMRIVASPFFSREDAEILRASSDESALHRLLASWTLDALDMSRLADEIAQNHVRALGWLLAGGRLEIRIVIPKDLGGADSGIFHQKVGILRDDEANLISFSGSVNETAAGWTQNVEEFKVFRSWEPSEAEWVNHDSALFARYWNGGGGAFRTLPLPEATRERLISYAPKSISDLDLNRPRSGSKKPVVALRLREYQSQAVEAWNDHHCRGILEMATGTGKTKTAIACLKPILDGREPSFTVVTAPFQHVAVQWADELKDYQPVCTFRGGDYRAGMANLSSDLRLGLRKAAVVVAVQNTAATRDFLELARGIGSQVRHCTLIADEVHGLGAPVMRQALGDFYQARLGLSATPHRWFDDEGSKVLETYFGGTIYTFGLHEALTWIDPNTGQTVLSPYLYYPVFVVLDDEELEKYASLTDRIVKQMQYNDDPDSNPELELLLFQRAAVVKTASQKIVMAESILDGLDPLSHALIYCHEKGQMREVEEVLQRRGVLYHRFTGNEGTTPSKDFKGMSEREWILQDLANGNTQALVAIKCLDEGVDVPVARLGIILASSGNPREFIQRRGRLLRRAPGKKHALIYDLIVAPSLSSLSDPKARELERKIFAKELDRIDEFARDADNALEARTRVLELVAKMV